MSRRAQEPLPMPQPPDEFKKRLERLQASLKRDKLDAMIVFDRHNAFYLTGLQCSLSYLLVTPRSARLLVDGRYIEAARKGVKHCEVQLFKKIAKSLQDWRREHEPKRVGLEGAIARNQWTLFAQLLPNLEWIESGKLILQMRLLKSASEIDSIQASAKLNDEIYEAALGQAVPGASELDLRNFIQDAANRRGAQGLSFESIVATGANGSMPHYRPGPAKLKRGDLLLIDMGMLLGGYCSDMTRVVGLGAKVPARMRKAFDATLAAEEAALKKVGPGMKCSDLHKIAVETLKKKGLARYFTHGLGHGVGLEIHEAPTLNAISQDVLKPGMIVTVEPGVYLPGLGGVRIEDLVAVTPSGHRVLSRAVKGWRALPFD